MKQLSQQNDIDKARLLHQLFKDEISRFVVFVDNTAKTMLENPAIVTDEWGGQKYSAEGWLQLAHDIQNRIEKNSYSLSLYAKRFSDQLFDGFTSLFTIQCLRLYKQITPNHRLAIAINLLFED